MDHTRRGGYTYAAADMLTGLQSRLNSFANDVDEEALRRRVLRHAASYLGRAEALLHTMGVMDDPEQSELRRASAQAQLDMETEPPTYPQGETPTERGAAAGREVIGWLDQLIPAWPADHKVIMAGHTVKGPMTGGTAVDYEAYPEVGSTNLPIGALMVAIKKVAEQGGPAAETIRQVLAEHDVPAAAAYRERDRQAMAELDARFNRPASER
jgi:hypothetical protein